jgi:capsular polysaccharide biosynthesis protein
MKKNQLSVAVAVAVAVAIATVLHLLSETEKFEREVKGEISLVVL